VPALVVPLWNVHGEIAFHQARPDHPRLRDGKPVKYETPPRIRMALDIHPVSRPALANPSLPLIVTEGIRKADAALSEGMAAGALLGVWNWRGTDGNGGRSALAGWEAIALHRRPGHPCFHPESAADPPVPVALDPPGRL